MAAMRSEKEGAAAWPRNGWLDGPVTKPDFITISRLLAINHGWGFPENGATPTMDGDWENPLKNG